MKACVTGGAGFIGSHVTDRLLADGHEVVVLDNLSTGRRENLAHVAEDVRFVEGDIRSAEDVAEAFAGCGFVIHLAALAAVARSIDDPREVADVNVGGTLNVLLGAKDAGVGRVVFASSSSVYGDTPTLPKVETMPTSPRSPYAATKVAGESYIQAFNASFGLEGVALRFFNVYGPRQSPRSRYAAVVPLFIEAALAKRPATIHGDGGQTRDFSFVTDTADAVVRAGTAPDAPGRVMNVGGGGRRVSVLELNSIIGDVVGTKLAPVHEPPRTGDVRDSQADIRQAEAALGWTPSTTVEEGIAKIVASWPRATS